MRVIWLCNKANVTEKVNTITAENNYKSDQ